MPYTPSFIKRENQYTKGGEYMISKVYVVKDDPKSEGKEYIGYYNVTSEGPFTGKIFSPSSKPLYNIKFASNISSQTYIKISSANGYVSDLEFDDPISTVIEPTNDDYNRGYFVRYFIQQRNDKQAKIKEIDQKQYDQLADLSGGLNNTRFKGVTLRWKLTGPKNDIIKNNVIFKSGVEDTNFRTLEVKSRILVGLDVLLQNKLVQYSEHDQRRDTNTDIKL